MAIDSRYKLKPGEEVDYFPPIQNADNPYLTEAAMHADQANQLQGYGYLVDGVGAFTYLGTLAGTAADYKASNVAHPLVETAVPVGALFTDNDTIYNDTAIQSEVTDNTNARHSHLNKPTLDKFGENVSGLPTYNGLSVDTTIAQRDVYDGLNSTDNTISLSANNGKVLKDVQDIQQTAININTAKETNIGHPLVEKAVPVGALFTDTVYDSTSVDNHIADTTTNPHNVTKSQVGLSNVPNLSFSGTNTGDQDLSGKEDAFSKNTDFNKTIVAGSNITITRSGNNVTINGESGSGRSIFSPSSGFWNFINGRTYICNNVDIAVDLPTTGIIGNWGRIINNGDFSECRFNAPAGVTINGVSAANAFVANEGGEVVIVCNTSTSWTAYGDLRESADLYEPKGKRTKIVTSSTYTILPGDYLKWLEFKANCTVTVPFISKGFLFEGEANGVTVTFVAESGVNIRRLSTIGLTLSPNGIFGIRYSAQDSCVIYGTDPI